MEYLRIIMRTYKLHFPDTFTEPLATKLWLQYKERVNRVIKPLPPAQRQEILFEIQSHIWESVAGDTAESEAEKVLNAAQKLGHPEEFLQPLVGAKLLENASRTLSPFSLAQSLYYMIGGNAAQSALTLIMSLLYSLLFVLALMVSLKFVFPEHVGLFAGENGGFGFGFITHSHTERYRDVLGYWFVPIGLAACVALYAAVTKIAYRIVRTIIRTGIAASKED